MYKCRSTCNAQIETGQPCKINCCKVPVMTEEEKPEPVGKFFMGLDFSTQQLKALVVDEVFTVFHEAKVHYDCDLPEYRTHGGVIQDCCDEHVFLAPTLMWVKALDLLLDRLTVDGLDFSRVAAISGSAQQHGSVYWQIGSSKMLEALNEYKFLHQQLTGCFPMQYSPTWMDSSTTKECAKFEQVVNGPEKLAEITGSRAYERFTGPQIAKVFDQRRDTYKAIERITLVSNFAATLFLGKFAPIDYSDASGMNLLDIKTKKWNQVLLDACARNLASKLDEPVPTNTILGCVSQYFEERYSFDPQCKVVAFTGDNPASLVGMQLKKEWIAVSLGTSDTLFFWLDEPKVIIDGHVMINPVNEDAYMAMLCFKNGSKTRERIRDDCAEKSWDTFNQLLDSTPRGNFGNIGLYYDVKEIIPCLMGDYRFNKEDKPVEKYSGLEVEVRAVIEGQFIAKRVYAEDMGVVFDKNTKIMATGGASVNNSILQVMADVFNAPVYTMMDSESAVWGAVYNARLAYESEMDRKDKKDPLEDAPEATLTCKPYADAENVYKPMIDRYRVLIKDLSSDLRKSISGAASKSQNQLINKATSSTTQSVQQLSQSKSKIENKI